MIAAAIAAIAAILSAPPEEWCTLTQLARQMGVAPSTSWRWATKGSELTRLPTVLIGSKRATTLAAFRTWCEQRTATADERLVPEEVAMEEKGGEEERAARAEAELARLGLNG